MFKIEAYNKVQTLGMNFYSQKSDIAPYVGNSLSLPFAVRYDVHMCEGMSKTKAARTFDAKMVELWTSLQARNGRLPNYPVTQVKKCFHDMRSLVGLIGAFARVIKFAKKFNEEDFGQPEQYSTVLSTNITDIQDHISDAEGYWSLMSDRINTLMTIPKIPVIFRTWDMFSKIYKDFSDSNLAVAEICIPGQVAFFFNDDEVTYVTLPNPTETPWTYEDWVSTIDSVLDDFETKYYYGATVMMADFKRVYGGNRFLIRDDYELEVYDTDFLLAIRNSNTPFYAGLNTSAPTSVPAVSRSTVEYASDGHPTLIRCLAETWTVPATGLPGIKDWNVTFPETTFKHYITADKPLKNQSEQMTALSMRVQLFQQDIQNGIWNGAAKALAVSSCATEVITRRYIFRYQWSEDNNLSRTGYFFPFVQGYLPDDVYQNNVIEALSYIDQHPAYLAMYTINDDTGENIFQEVVWDIDEKSSIDAANLELYHTAIMGSLCKVPEIKQKDRTEGYSPKNKPRGDKPPKEEPADK